MIMEYSDWYKLVDHPDSNNNDHWCIELLKGDYAGVVYQYGTIGFAKTANDDGTLTLKFDYDVIHVPDHLSDKEYSDEDTSDIITLLGNILSEIINDDINHKGEEKDIDGSIGNDNTDGIIARRTFYPKSDPLSKG